MAGKLLPQPGTQHHGHAHQHGGLCQLHRIPGQPLHQPDVEVGEVELHGPVAEEGQHKVGQQARLQQQLAGRERGQLLLSRHRRPVGQQPEHQQQVAHRHGHRQPGRQAVIPGHHGRIAPYHGAQHPAQVHADVDAGEVARLGPGGAHVRRHRLHYGDVAVEEALHHPAQQQERQGAPGDPQGHQHITRQHPDQAEGQHRLATMTIRQLAQPGGPQQLKQRIEPHDDPEPQLAAPVRCLRRQHALGRIQHQRRQHRRGQTEARHRQGHRHHQYPEGRLSLDPFHLRLIK